MLTWAIGILVSIPSISLAQQDLSLKDAVMAGRSTLAPERLRNLHWIPNTNSYTYTEDSENGRTLIKVNASDFNTSEIISTSELASLLMVKKAMKRLPNFNWLSTNEAYFIYAGSVYSFNAKSKKVSKRSVLPKDGSNLTFRPGSTDFAFTRTNNLFISINGVETPVTVHTDPNIVAGQTVSRVEFGIEKGIIWSAKGNALAFYEKDETNVTNYPLVDYSTRPAHVKNTKYPMAGMASEEVKIGVYSLKTKAVIYLNSNNAKESYLTSLSWDPSEKFVYAANLNRGQDSLVLNQYDAKTGNQTIEILKETDPEYIHPTHGLHFVEKGEFLWQTEIAGFNQFQVYNVDGNTHWKVNTPNIIVRSFLGYDAASRKVWFLGNHKDKIDQHLFVASLDPEGATVFNQITKGDAYHSSAILTDDHKFAIVRSSSLTTPNSYDLIELENGSISNLMTAENPLKAHKIGETRLETLTANDGTTILHTRMVLPYDFDETKKYPVLIYVYNGPGVQLLHSNWLASASLWMHHFANKGYIVYTLDGRGSTNRGIEFEQSTFKQLGQLEMQDQMTGVDHLKNLPYVDATRIGVHGWSYGGFMTTSLLTSYPGEFKVGVAGGPVMDWSYYEVMYTERYMDTPATNMEGFAMTSNIKRAKELKDPLLIIHGTADPTVVKQNSDLFLRECIKNGVQVDYFEYPGAAHNVRGKDRVHLIQKILDYVESYL